MMKHYIIPGLLILVTGCTAGIVSSDNLTYDVTKLNGTEPAFNNAYWNETRPGLYVDVNTGEALFISLDKFESGTGWPSFTKPLENTSIQESTDASFGLARTEVHTSASHLGHVFDDGPNGNLRYCINSAALRFIAYSELDSAGYGQYKKMFDNNI